jgi:7,8-dihydropterin-6-yl-methyl-4-(beta-D-ribofuranosyl)aminobenzene 5'-phosphate synthase
VHEDMFKIRGTINPDGTVTKAPSFPTVGLLRPAKVVKTKEAKALTDKMILVTGEIPRKTGFEKGLLKQMAYVNGEWQPDPWVWDDRALVLSVKDKGLVVISGCAHAGIINTMQYAQKLTLVNRVHAVFGGFHLAGKDYETKITPTVDKLTSFNPRLIVPSHCTGWRGIYAIMKAMPEAFVWNSVGNLYQL